MLDQIITDPNYLIISDPNYSEENKLKLLKSQKNFEWINKKFFDKNTALHLAISQKNHLKMLSFLIDKGANINLQNNLGDTPLHWAIKQKRIKTATILIKKSANINLQNNLGDTPLHLVITELPEKKHPEKKLNKLPEKEPPDKKLELAELLIKFNSDLTLKDKIGEEPLHVAVKYNSPKIVKLLIESKCPLTSKNQLGETPLHLATNTKSPVLLLMLCSKPEVKKTINELDLEGNTALHKAVYSGSVACIKILMSQPLLDAEILNNKGTSARNLVHTLEFDNYEEILNAFRTVPISNSLTQEYLKGSLFPQPNIYINTHVLIDLKTQFNKLKIDRPFKATTKDLIAEIKDITLNTEDFMEGRLSNIESFLLAGGDPNDMISNQPLLYYAFVYSQHVIFLRLIQAGATFRQTKLIELIESKISPDQSNTHAKFIQEVHNKIFALAHKKMESCKANINDASDELEKKLAEHRLIQWFKDDDITIIEEDLLDKKFPQDMAYCIKSLYYLSFGKIESSVRFFDNLFIKKCIFGLLDEFEPIFILDALINLAATINDLNTGLSVAEEAVKEVEKPKKICLTNLQKLIFVYILKEVIILNLEFRYDVFNIEFHGKIKRFFEIINCSDDLRDALLRLNDRTAKLMNSSIYSSYFELSKLVHKYPSSKGISIKEKIRSIVSQSSDQFNSSLAENAEFLALQMRVLVLQFSGVCPLTEFKKSESPKNSPNITLFQNRLNALSHFVSSQIKQQSNEQYRANAFILLTHAANCCLKIKNEIGADFNSMMAILSGIDNSNTYQEKEILSLIDKNTTDLFKQLQEVCKPMENFKCIRALLGGYFYPLPPIGIVNLDVIHMLGKAKKNEGLLSKKQITWAMFIESKLSSIGEIYFRIHSVNSKIALLHKNTETDLLYQLSLPIKSDPEPGPLTQNLTDNNTSTKAKKPSGSNESSTPNLITSLDQLTETKILTISYDLKKKLKLTKTNPMPQSTERGRTFQNKN